MNLFEDQDDKTQVKLILERIKAKSSVSDGEVFQLLDNTATILLRNLNSHDPKETSIVVDCLRIFRQSCPLGPDIQCYVVQSLEIIASIQDIIINPNAYAHIDGITTVSWQLLANLIINNSTNQKLVWNNFHQFFMNCLTTTGYPHKDICRMIIYNIYCIGGLIQDKGKELLKILLQNLDEQIQFKDCSIPEFLQIFLEHFIIKQKRITPLYLTLDSNERILMLHFIADYIKEGHSSDLSDVTELLQCMCKEFKKKSDCVLKTESTYLNRIEPKEVMALLEVIAQASGEKSYRRVFEDDASLFLNAGCLLRNIQAIGKKGDNLFSPIKKLEQIAPSSISGSCVEREISYSLKTMVVRTIGNLAYRNTKNQDLAREMDIMNAVLDCTHMDARNPLIKEWSILAIRNLCEANFENQQLIASLTKVGEADNSEILKEFNIDLGSMRINPSP